MKYLSMAIAAVGIMGISAWYSVQINHPAPFILGVIVMIFIVFAISTTKDKVQ